MDFGVPEQPAEHDPNAQLKRTLLTTSSRIGVERALKQTPYSKGSTKWSPQAVSYLSPLWQGIF